MSTFAPIPIFLKEQLNHVIDLAFKENYPALKARNFIPVNRNIPQAAETVSAKIWDSFGKAKILNPRADDFPKGSINHFESFVPIKSIGTSFGYSLMDLRRSQMAGTNLDAREASAARLRIESFLDELAAQGEHDSGIYGLINHPTITDQSSFKLDNWFPKDKPAKTGEQILKDISQIVSSIAERTSNALLPDTMILPIRHYAYLAQTPFANNSNVTILNFLLNNNPYIKNIDSWVHLKDTLIIYPRTPQALEMYIPLEFEMLPPQAKGMNFEVFCHARFGGVHIYTPKACAYGTGI